MEFHLTVIVCHHNCLFGNDSFIWEVSVPHTTWLILCIWCFWVLFVAQNLEIMLSFDHGILAITNTKIPGDKLCNHISVYVYLEHACRCRHIAGYVPGHKAAMFQPFRLWPFRSPSRDSKVRNMISILWHISSTIVILQMCHVCFIM